MNVAIYARVSTMNGQDPEMQLRELREYCHRRGWTAVAEYVDAGISGAKEKRPELDKLLADAHRRLFDAVVVWRFDRFARSVSCCACRYSVAAGTEFRPHTSAGIEIDIQIPIIQAPFRIYYAYNYLRLSQTILPPLGAFFVPPAERDSLKQLGVYDTQIVPALQDFLIHTQSSQTIPPGLFEPKTTLRFAVSRTF